jgi:hypothetical protein
MTSILREYLMSLIGGKKVLGQPPSSGTVQYLRMEISSHQRQEDVNWDDLHPKVVSFVLLSEVREC